MAEISTIARPYAVAVFKLAKDDKKLGSWSKFLGLLSGLIKNKDLQNYLEDTKVLDAEREKIPVSYTHLTLPPKRIV